MKKLILSLVMLSMLTQFTSCGGDTQYTPKPKGYMRIDFPGHQYAEPDSMHIGSDTSAIDVVDLPFTFETNSVTLVTLKKNERRLKWVDIKYPAYNGVIFLTYIPLREKGDLAGQIDTSTQLLTKHYSFSSGIDERLFVNEEERVYATSYLLKGQNVASTYQFWATDSVNHFLRGSLYIDCVPNNDSLAPVLEYLQQDMDHLIETLKWK